MTLAGAVSLLPPPPPQAGVGLLLDWRLVQLLTKSAHGLRCSFSLVDMYRVVSLGWRVSTVRTLAR